MLHIQLTPAEFSFRKKYLIRQLRSDMLKFRVSCSSYVSFFFFWLSSSSFLCPNPPLLTWSTTFQNSSNLSLVVPWEIPVSGRLVINARFHLRLHERLSERMWWFISAEPWFAHTWQLACKLKLAARLLDTSKRTCGFAHFLLSASKKQEVHSSLWECVRI